MDLNKPRKGCSQKCSQIRMPFVRVASPITEMTCDFKLENWCGFRRIDSEKPSRFNVAQAPSITTAESAGIDGEHLRDPASLHLRRSSGRRFRSWRTLDPPRQAVTGSTLFVRPRVS